MEWNEAANIVVNAAANNQPIQLNVMVKVLDALVMEIAYLKEKVTELSATH